MKAIVTRSALLRQPFAYPQASGTDDLDDPDDNAYDPIEFVDEGDEF
jgi:hypothetical protein